MDLALSQRSASIEPIGHTLDLNVRHCSTELTITKLQVQASALCKTQWHRLSKTTYTSNTNSHTQWVRSVTSSVGRRPSSRPNKSWVCPIVWQNKAAMGALLTWSSCAIILTTAHVVVTTLRDVGSTPASYSTTNYKHILQRAAESSEHEDSVVFVLAHRIVRPYRVGLWRSRHRPWLQL